MLTGQSFDDYLVSIRTEESHQDYAAEHEPVVTATDLERLRRAGYAVRRILHPTGESGAYISYLVHRTVS